ncbi:MAG TPA: 30S ribosome-binding factor RbfA [Bacteroidales bacterium]|nr:30S ribosome-binding factor RbfA [Bacteroidales bacterium]HRZ76991.1 30S ribosome-binding factor RbfA [Bacteroidales bacterium]
METTRQQKVNRLLQRELGSIFQQEGPALSRAMVTVTRVKITPDLGLARVHLSIFGVADKAAELSHIRSHSREIRHKLAQRTRQQLRIIPELEFHQDDSLDYIENIDRLLDH